MTDAFSKNELTILAAFEGNVRLQLSGTEISQKTRIGSGRLYPALSGLEKKRCLKSAWDEKDVNPDLPRRRLYTLTGEGHGKLAEQSDKRGFLSGLILGNVK